MFNTSVGVIFLLILITACDRGETKNNVTVSENHDQSANEENRINLNINDDEKKVDVFIDGEIFTSYLYSDTLKKPVLYPLKTSQGTIVTRGFPLDPRPGERTDHPHHIGLWFNYGDVNGLDFWNNSDNISIDNADRYGTVVHREITKVSSSDDVGELGVTMDWVDHNRNVLLRETTIFQFRTSGNRRIIDRITKLTAPDKDVSMYDNKEGMLGIRMAHELEHPDEGDEATGMYRSSEGLEGTAVWGTRAKWMNLSGRVDGESVSVAILDHPENVGYPTYWHARGYGLYAANPLGQEALSDGKEELNFNLSAGESVTFKYRVIIYSAEEASDEKVNQDWKEFVR